MKLDVASITNDNAALLLARGVEAIRAGDATIDLATVREVNTAAVALLLAWKRESQAAGKPLRFAGVPDGIASLAQLYGVDSELGIEDRSADS